MLANPLAEADMKKSVIYVLFILVSIPAAVQADILIIAHKDVPVATLSKRAVKEIFLGKQVQWSDHSKIRFAVVRQREVHNLFLEKYVNKTASQWKAYWKRMVFTGRGDMPLEFETAAALLDHVAKTKGAVGYIDTVVSSANVKVIIVE